MAGIAGADVLLRSLGKRRAQNLIAIGVRQWQFGLLIFRDSAVYLARIGIWRNHTYAPLQTVLSSRYIALKALLRVHRLRQRIAPVGPEPFNEKKSKRGKDCKEPNYSASFPVIPKTNPRRLIPPVSARVAGGQREDAWMQSVFGSPVSRQRRRCGTETLRRTTLMSAWLSHYKSPGCVCCLLKCLGTNRIERRVEQRAVKICCGQNVQLEHAKPHCPSRTLKLHFCEALLQVEKFARLTWSGSWKFPASCQSSHHVAAVCRHLEKVEAQRTASKARVALMAMPFVLER